MKRCTPEQIFDWRFYWWRNEKIGGGFYSNLVPMDQGQNKRARISCNSTEGGPRLEMTGNDFIKAPSVQEGSLESQPPTQFGFYLTRLKNAPAKAQEFALGVADILEGRFTRCLLANYMFDIPWLFRECPRLHDVPIVLVHGERDHLSMERQCTEYKNVNLVSPHLPIPYGTHHTKMMVVVYPFKVRVAIFTANLIPIDWNNKTQGIWFQDFGLKVLGDGTGRCVSQPSAFTVDFESDLVDYLKTLGGPVVSFCQILEHFDFSTANIALIPSVPGLHTGKRMEKYGHLRVRKLLRHFQTPLSDHPLICQFSSMGSLDEKWLFGEFTRSLMPGMPATGTALPIKSFHIIWPTVSDIQNSIEGWSSGRAVPCPMKNMKPFLHKYLRKWTPPSLLFRQNAMPHMKSYARFDPTTQGSVDWCILTSANLSKAAWGTYQKKESQFMIRSYELGVLFLPQFMVQDKNASLCVLGSPRVKTNSVDSLLVQLPLPYSFPMTTYDPQEDEPWVWDLVRDEPDIYGSCYIPR